MKVEHLMSRDVEACAPRTTLTDAAMIMWRRDCGFVPVVEEAAGKLVGVITDRDICVATATKHRSPDAIRVEEVMTKETFTCAPGDTIRAAAHRMAESQVRRLPVVDRQRRLLGVLTLNDLVLAAERDITPPAEGVGYTDVMGILKAVSAHRIPTPSVEGSRA